MKRIVLLLGAILISQTAMAGTISEGAVVCMSKKYLQRYEMYKEQNAELFIDDMFARAQCYKKKSEAFALKLSEVGDHLKVETEDGFSVWLNSADYSE